MIRREYCSISGPSIECRYLKHLLTIHTKKDQKTGQTIDSYRTKFDHPITLSAGQHIILGERSTDQGWEDWIWSIDEHGRAGWVPIQLISCGENMTSGIMLENYNARELNIDAGEPVDVLSTMNGWSWVRRQSDHEEGWIPNNILKESDLPAH